MDISSRASRLADMHELFARLLKRNGEPPSWRRTATFGTIVRFVLEQQVSLASARAAYGRLVDLIGEPEPHAFAGLSDPELRSAGFSRQKTRYVRAVAERMISGDLDLDRAANSGEAGRAELLSVPGIGPWTLACFEIFVVNRPDVWPTGDRALYVSMARNLDRDQVPSRQECDEIARTWAPHRSTAARMLWHDYLGGATYEEDPSSGFLPDRGIVPA